jgi:phytoene dehydrogenase-like protein
MTSAETSATRDADVIVVGAGLNGLVCALVLARAGLQVLVLDDKPVIGGAHRTEYPFAHVPRLGTSTGLHRLGVVPKDLGREIGVELPVVTREPALFAPTVTPGRYLLAGSGSAGLQSARGGGVVGERDAQALAAMDAELDGLAEDLAPAWTGPVATLEEIAGRHVRPALRTPFLQLCRGTIAEYAARFGIRSGLVKGLLAADAVSGSFVSWDSPGSGATLLVRHVAAGAAELAIGGASALARTLSDAAQATGVTFALGTAVTQIAIEGNIATGIVLADGTLRRAAAVVTSADPWRLRAMVGAERLPPEYTRRLDSFMRPGGIAKLNLALSALPRFACLDEDLGQHRATVFLLPNDDDAVRTLGRAFADANAGRLPAEPPLECIFPSAADPSLADPEGRHSASILVPWVPYDLAGTTWSAEEERFTSLLLGVLDAFAPGTRDLVVETSLLHPKKIESHFGLTRGHVFHVDDTHLFGDRLPPHTPISGLYACGRGCGPAGRFLGVAGLIAARRVMADFQLANERTEVGARALPQI